MSPRLRSGRLFPILCTVGIGLLATEASAIEPASSASFQTVRVSINNGGSVQLSGGGSYQVTPQVVGGGAVGTSASPSFAINHGRVGSLVFLEDDIFVDPGFFAQADVDNHPTVGLAGCRPPVFPLVLGANAFDNIADALDAVNEGGRVILLNADHFAEEVVVAKSVHIFGYDESLNTCTGLPGRLGAIILPASDTVGTDKATFRIESANVRISDLTIDGDNPAFAGTDSEIEHGILVADASGDYNNLRVDNAIIRSARTSGVQIFAPGTNGHVIEGVDIELVGDVLADGSSDGAGVRIGSATASVIDGSVRFAQSGVVAFGDGSAAPAPIAGSGSPAVVNVAGTIFEVIGDAGVGIGSTSSRGAVAYVANAAGVVADVTVSDSDFGVAVAGNSLNGTIRIEDSLFVGPLRVGIDLRDIAAAAPGDSMGVEVVGNTFTSPVNQAAIAVRNVGRDSGGTLEAGSVLIAGNLVDAISGSVQNPYGIFAKGIDTAQGSLVIESNVLRGLSSIDSQAGIQIDSRDILNGALTPVSSANVEISDNTIEDWQAGVVLVNSGASGSANVEADFVGGNVLRNNISGLNVNQNALANFIAGPDTDEIRDNQVGVIAGTTSSVANLRNAEIVNNTQSGVRATNGANVLIEDSYVENALNANSVGVRALTGGATIDMGGGALGSTGGNVFNVVGTGDNWAVSLEVAGTYSAEQNEWRFNGEAFNGPSAIDDLIRDGDMDNPFAVSESGTVGPLDFIPFVAGTLEDDITIDQSASRLTPGYGVTVFRTLGDAPYAVAAGGTATLLDGLYPARSYDGDSDFVVNTVTLDRGATYIADNPGGAVIIPAANGPGTDAADLLEPGSVTVLEIAASNVALEGLVVDGDSPALPSPILVGGAEINARNGIVLLGSAGNGPNDLSLNNVTVRNVLYRGLAMAPAPGSLFENIVITDSAFQNIRGDNTVTPDSMALELVDSRNVMVESSTFSAMPVGVSINPNDDSTIHIVEGSTFSNISGTSILATGIEDVANILLIDNNISGGVSGIEVTGLANGGVVNVSANQIANSESGVLARGIGDQTLVLVAGNTLTGTSASTVGVRTVDVQSSGPGTGVIVAGNLIQSQNAGVLVRNALGADNNGTSILGNEFVGNNFGIDVSDTGLGGELFASIGGNDTTDRNTFDDHVVAIAVRGANATAEIRNNGGSAIPRDPAFFDQDTGILVDNGAAAIIENNYIEGSSIAAIRVRNGSEARLDLNNMPGDENRIGVLIESGARASLGPGTADPLTNAFFGATTTASGLNRFRSYTGSGGNFAIENTSILDQNAQNNDFGTLDPAEIEVVVEHQPDNGQGLVLYDPPSNQFLSVDDWSTLHRD